MVLQLTFYNQIKKLKTNIFIVSKKGPNPKLVINIKIRYKFKISKTIERTKRDFEKIFWIQSTINKFSSCFLRVWVFDWRFDYAILSWLSERYKLWTWEYFFWNFAKNHIVTRFDYCRFFCYKSWLSAWYF
jgi:hypothetical protein